MRERTTGKLLSLLIPGLLFGACAVAAEENIAVTVTGTLQTGIAAIGGETTGATITAKGVTWELDFGGDAALREAAEVLNGKQVIVQGSLERRAGVEIPVRWIVTVTALRAAGDAGVRFESDGENTVIEITSRLGIDAVTIERETETWPDPILVRLHLGGLESFEAGTEDVAVEWSVSSSGDHASRVSLRTGRREEALDAASPYHTDLRIVGGNGEIPLEGGYFEVPLPSALFDGNPREITLRWIDFHRS